MAERMFEDGSFWLWSNANPVCPHCSALQEVTDLNGRFGDFIDGDTIETECDSCDEEFYVQLNISVRYNTFVTKK